MNKIINRRLTDIYNQLYEYYGPQHWWPAEESFEVMVGADFGLSPAAWVNVEKSPNKSEKVRSAKPAAFKSYLTQSWSINHACGYYNVKALSSKLWLIGSGQV